MALPAIAIRWLNTDGLALLVRLCVALAVAVVGLMIARSVRETTHREVVRVRSDRGLALFTSRIAWFAVLFLALLTVLSVLGINWTSMLAVVGAVGLAISLALQDVLRNLFAGLYLLLERPFQIGDRIDVRTFSGAVEDVRLRVTVLRTPAGLQVVIPNAVIFTEAIVNRSAYGHERFVVRIVQTGGDDPRAVQSRVLDASKDLPSLMSSPPPQISLVAISPEKQTIDLACWTSDRSCTLTALLESLSSALPRAEITVEGGATT